MEHVLAQERSFFARFQRFFFEHVSSQLHEGETWTVVPTPCQYNNNAISEQMDECNYTYRKGLQMKLENGILQARNAVVCSPCFPYPQLTTSINNILYGCLICNGNSLHYANFDRTHFNGYHSFALLQRKVNFSGYYNPLLWKENNETSLSLETRKPLI